MQRIITEKQTNHISYHMKKQKNLNSQTTEPQWVQLKTRTGNRPCCDKKKVSEYDQEIPQSQIADNREEEPLKHHKTPGRQIKQSNQLSLPHQDDCNTRMDIK